MVIQARQGRNSATRRCVHPISCLPSACSLPAHPLIPPTIQNAACCRPDSAARPSLPPAPCRSCVPDARPAGQRHVQLLPDAANVCGSPPSTARSVACREPPCDGCGCDSPPGQIRLYLRATIRRVRPHLRAGVARVQQLLEHLAIVHRRIRHLIGTDQLVPMINAEMVLVAVAALAMLLRPAGLRILLAALRFRLLLRRLAALDARVLVPAVALPGHFHNRRIHDLALPRPETRCIHIRRKRCEWPTLTSV